MRAPLRYAIAALVAALATALKLALSAYIVPTFILAYPAVMLAAAVGGLGPGILATVLSAAMAWYWVIPPQRDFHPLSVQEGSSLALFVLMGILVSAMAERLRRSRSRVGVLEAERALRAAEAKFRTYVEASPDALFVADGRGRFVDGNPAALAMLGIDLQALQASKITDYVREADQEATRLKFGVLTSEGHVEYDRRFVRPDGREVWARVRAVKLSDDRMMAFCRDITEQVAAEEELRRREARLRAYFESPAVGVAISGADMRWLEANDFVCEMSGYTRAELLRLSWVELSYPDDLPSDLAAFQRLLRGETDRYTVDKRFIRKDGSIVWAMASVSCVRGADGGVDCVIGIFKDITERKRTEVALRSAKVENEKLIGELRSALQSVKTLSGLLPICMYCKKIRNDTGYWDRIEHFISTHTEARFSHGMCGDCARTHHAELFPGEKS